MSERERWIVYPLLLFALGAGVRDKLMDRVEAKEIRCERLQIVDQQDPDRSLAELGFKRAINSDPTRLADRVGALILKDSDGKEICDISHDVIVGRVIARQLAVIDEMRRPLVLALTEPLPVMTPGQGDGAVSYQGVIYLNNQRLGIRLAPPANQPATNLSPPNPAEAPPEANP